MRRRNGVLYRTTCRIITIKTRDELVKQTEREEKIGEEMSIKDIVSINGNSESKSRTIDIN